MPGIQEWLVIAVVALVVVGPNRLPGVARMVGQLVLRLRHEAVNATSALRDQADLGEITGELRELRRELQDTKRLASSAMRDVAHGNPQDPGDGPVGLPRPGSRTAPEAVAVEPVAEPPSRPTTGASPGDRMRRPPRNVPPNTRAGDSATRAR